MHKLTVLFATVSIGIVMLSGCGNSGKNADKANREDATLIHENEKVGGSLETGDGYGFSSFDLDIEIDGKDVVEVDYEVHEKLEATYENKLKNIKSKDQEAMNEIDKLFMAILINKDTPPQEVIVKILNWYQIELYSKFDLEVYFDDGTRLDIEDVQ